MLSDGGFGGGVAQGAFPDQLMEPVPHRQGLKEFSTVELARDSQQDFSSAPVLAVQPGRTPQGLLGPL